MTTFSNSNVTSYSNYEVTSNNISLKNKMNKKLTILVYNNIIES